MRRLNFDTSTALTALSALTALAACEANPGLSTGAQPDPCTLGEVKACTCDSGRQSTAACGGEGFFLDCRCGQTPAGGFADASRGPDPDAERASPAPTAPPRRQDAAPSPDAGPEDAVFADAAPLTDAGETPDARPPDARPPPPPDLGPSDEPLNCAEAPETQVVAGVTMFRYEASHPLATAASAFPGAVSESGGPSAPARPTQACSRPGVRPWHSITAAGARAACEGMGWRVCSAAELLRACGGEAGTDWTWGSEFDAAACNLRQVYQAPGAATTSEAPTGTFPRCVSAEGVFDLSGNLWEWTDEGSIYVGGGWRILAEHHRETDLVCAAQVRAAQDFQGPDVGFRCCRDAR